MTLQREQSFPKVSEQFQESEPILVARISVFRSVI